MGITIKNFIRKHWKKIIGGVVLTIITIGLYIVIRHYVRKR